MVKSYVNVSLSVSVFQFLVSCSIAGTADRFTCACGKKRTNLIVLFLSVLHIRIGRCCCQLHIRINSAVDRHSSSMSTPSKSQLEFKSKKRTFSSSSSSSSSTQHWLFSTASSMWWSCIVLSVCLQLLSSFGPQAVQAYSRGAPEGACYNLLPSVSPLSLLL